MNARLVGLLLAATLTGCGGAYSGTNGLAETGTGGGGGGGGDDDPVYTCDELFAQRVQPRLEFCRSCHVAGGVADVPGGNRLKLDSDPAGDEAALRAAWQLMPGTAQEPSEILKMASGTASRPHSGGTPWPVGGAAYADVASLLAGFDDPAACVTPGGELPPELPLLGSKRALHAWEAFCEGDGTEAHPPQPPEALLPPDPRSLVRPGVNTDKAVYFNAFWEDCHVNLPATEQRATTCGEYRARRERGRLFLLDELPTGNTSAASFNDTWKKWGLSTRPADFDRMYTLRYGLNHAPFHNPYPIRKPDGTMEDPNQTNGGSGQLPMGLRQGKNAEGRWTGQIGSAACYSCHGGQVGDPKAGDPEVVTFASLGLGNNNYDVPMSGRDSSPFASSPAGAVTPGMSIESVFNLGIKQRGQNNAVGAFELLVTILDLDSLGVNPNPAKMGASPSGPQDTAHPLAHTQDTPPWWNMGSRPRKFFDAGVSNDSTRIIMAAGGLAEIFSQNGKPYRDRIEKYDQDLEAFFLSLRSPEYPREVDTALAEQGAILFHNKNLWAPNLNNPSPAPAGGNGSCASCHGAYSPRFVNDPAFLDDPSFEGIAAHIAPLEVIGTDRARSDMLTPTLRKRWDATFWGYNDGLPGWTSPDSKDFFTETADDMWPAASDFGVDNGTPGTRPVGVCGWEKNVIGYQAPPLYGTWATAPYFHNGSVPTLEAVLDPSKRHTIWRRQLETIGPVTGFDQRLSAYDFDALGWKHEALACTDMPGTELMNCSPMRDESPSLTQVVSNLLAGLGYAGATPVPDPAANAIEKRLVYDTRTLGNSSAGHEFTAVLTEAERRAILEYLKTL
jgi:endo-cleaving rubber dioxygenase